MSVNPRSAMLFASAVLTIRPIHFGAVVTPSSLTQKSLYQALAAARPGHEAVWDEGAHGPADPVLGDGCGGRTRGPYSRSRGVRETRRRRHSSSRQRAASATTSSRGPSKLCSTAAIPSLASVLKPEARLARAATAISLRTHAAQPSTMS